ncbi:MAG: hypothetical protein A2832_01875 [Candidatus Zambryskibacteria bacterium RIFCSPHIGHO2_01_FULL_44_22b]|uniref:DNA polymerase III delta N-terminal domain-containing protein n=2 Tax=Candidatus Zambryskiibacteriota TaxID=1817925 RepID=A0A1G2SXU7_9BACT|nr:MAG: hypothetical protein A2832_01875 [Candidatus Zambryskibacteria bacterium RIFCSPHIGHO2_01_FULL_44_22b]OHB04895.1 MAG: hypothetical protein A3B16_01640 [Candidatus Zambryskibacteria bacterium RIFCSPLOWO2_01_FULL_45_43]
MSRNLNNLHHANLVIGGLEEAEKLLHETFPSLKGSPDFFVFKNETFGIDEARELSQSAVRRAFTDKKVYLIASGKITIEAQNALLKTFEDPAVDTYFFLVVKGEELILPTLRSRMQVVRHLAVKPPSTDAEKFIGLSIKDRMLFVKKFVDDERNLSDFLDSLLLLTKSEQVYKFRLFADDRSASSRLILEHLALVLE